MSEATQRFEITSIKHLAGLVVLQTLDGESVRPPLASGALVTLAPANGEGAAPAQDPNCICRGNWRAIVKETEHLIRRYYKRLRDDVVFHFFGIVHADDDYYYGMWNKSEGLLLISCVGAIDHGMELLEPGYVRSAQAAPALEASAVAALRRLEQACDKRAELTTPEVYKAIVVLPGMKDALQELDDARKQACAVLSAGTTGPEKDLIAAADSYADLWADGESIPANEVRAAITNAYYRGHQFGTRSATGDEALLRQALDAMDSIHPSKEAKVDALRASSAAIRARLAAGKSQAVAIEDVACSESLRAALMTMDEPEMMAQQIVQRGAMHALTTLQSHGCSAQAVQDMLASLRSNMQVIEAVAREKGFKRLFEEPNEKEGQHGG